MVTQACATLSQMQLPARALAHHFHSLVPNGLWPGLGPQTLALAHLRQGGNVGTTAVSLLALDSSHLVLPQCALLCRLERPCG